MNIVELMTECGERPDQILDPPWVVWAWMEIETGTFIGEVKLVMHVFLTLEAPGEKISTVFLRNIKQYAHWILYI